MTSLGWKQKTNLTRLGSKKINFTSFEMKKSTSQGWSKNSAACKGDGASVGNFALERITCPSRFS